MTFKVFNENDVLTAADVNLLMRQGTAIVTSATRPSSPIVGQRIRETDTGFTREWNGSQWALWPGGAQSLFDSTNLSTSGTTYLAGTPNVKITFTAPPSGKLFVSVAGNLEGGSGGGSCALTWELRNNTTDAVVVAAGDENGVLVQGTNNVQAANRVLVTGLTDGQTYYVRTLHHATVAGDTVNVFNRRLTIEPCAN